MSTRSTTHFIYKDEKDPQAIVYRHTDGYPSGAGMDILGFLEEVGKLRDNRFGDPTYLAAKYVVFLANMFTRGDSKLDFLSVGVCTSDPGDIAYRYVVDCGNVQPDGKPTVKCYQLENRFGENGFNGPTEWKLVEVPIQPEVQQ